MLIHNLVATGSISYNGVNISYVTGSQTSLDGLNQFSASVNTTTGSLNSTTGSLNTATGSLFTASGSFSTRVTNTESTASVLTTASASFAVVSSSYSSASGSLSTRVSKIEGNYATTGSNIFTGAQTVCANITSTGTIIAQTLNVQQVTSSIVYSSGSNVFGCSTSDVQQMTGSVRITGSLNTIGNACMTSVCSPTFVGGTMSGTTIYASTVACSPIGCFATSCATSFVGGTVSGTTIYGSTAVCAPSIISSGTICSTGNTCFGGMSIIASCLGIGTASPDAKLSVNGGMSIYGVPIVKGDGTSSNGRIEFYSDNTPTYAASIGTTAAGIAGVPDGSLRFALYNGSWAERMRITSGGNVGIGTGSPSAKLEVSGAVMISGADAVAIANRGALDFSSGNTRLLSFGANTSTKGGFDFLTLTSNGTGGSAMTITSGGNVEVTTTTFAQVKINNAATTGANRGTGFEVNSTTNAGTNFIGQFNAVSNNANVPYSSTDGIYLMSRTSGFPLIFTTNNGGTEAERMRITSGGNVGIGTANPGYRLHSVVCNNTAAAAAVIYGCYYGGIVATGQTSSTYYGFKVMNAANGDTSVGNDLFIVRADGLIYTGTAALSPYNYGVSGVALYVASSGAIGYTTSTRESKSNISNIDNVNWIHSLQPVTFNKKKKDNEGNYTEELEPELQYGLIAEDVENVNSNFVFYNNEGKLAGVHYDRLVTPLLKAIQELKCQNDIFKTCLGIA